MAIINKGVVTIDVDVKMHVDIDTALKALNIIDIWLDENPERQIEAAQCSDGKWIMNLIPEAKESSYSEEEL